MKPPNAPCPMCGAYSLLPDSSSTALLAVCDVLVLKALETMGKRIVRVHRRRYAELGDTPWHEAHRLWPPDQVLIAKTLKGAWAVVPAMVDQHGCCGIPSHRIVQMLDEYVRDLALTGEVHSTAELRYRMVTRLEVDLPEVIGKTGDGAKTKARTEAMAGVSDGR